MIKSIEIELEGATTLVIHPTGDFTLYSNSFCRRYRIDGCPPEDVLDEVMMLLKIARLRARRANTAETS